MTGTSRRGPGHRRRFVVARGPCRASLGALLFGIVLALSRGARSRIQLFVQVRAVLTPLHPVAARGSQLITILNISIMGLFVDALRSLPNCAIERWKFGAVAFCWSNFLTLGPLAGPAIRFWLYRTRVNELSELHAGIVSVVIAFTSGLAGWTLAALVVSRVGGGLAVLGVVALGLVLMAAWIGRAIALRTDRFGGPAVE